jgi:hypothetical protein
MLKWIAARVYQQIMRGQTEFTNPEVTGEDLELCPWNGDTFDKGMFLVFECQHCFIEDDPFIFFGKHPHEALHEILRGC